MPGLEKDICEGHMLWLKDKYQEEFAKIAVRCR